MEAAPRIVTGQDWYDTGFRDAKHGNPKQPPAGPGSAESKMFYMTGYAMGQTVARRNQ